MELSIDEVWTLMEGQGVAIAEAWHCFAEYNVVNSGSIGIEEYLRVGPPLPLFALLFESSSEEVYPVRRCTITSCKKY